MKLRCVLRDTMWAMLINEFVNLVQWPGFMVILERIVAADQ